MPKAKSHSVAFRPSPEMLHWIDQQADAMHLSRGAIVRYYLEQAMGHDPEAAILRQYAIQTVGHMTMRVKKALAIVMPAFSKMLAKAIMLDSTDPHQLERAFQAQVDKIDAALGDDDTPQTAKPKKKRRRRRKNKNRT